MATQEVLRPTRGARDRACACVFALPVLALLGVACGPPRTQPVSWWTHYPVRITTQLVEKWDYDLANMTILFANSGGWDPVEPEGCPGLPDDVEVTVAGEPLNVAIQGGQYTETFMFIPTRRCETPMVDDTFPRDVLLGGEPLVIEVKDGETTAVVRTTGAVDPRISLDSDVVEAGGELRVTVGSGEIVSLGLSEEGGEALPPEVCAYPPGSDGALRWPAQVDGNVLIVTVPDDAPTIELEVGLDCLYSEVAHPVSECSFSSCDLRSSLTDVLTVTVTEPAASP
jgi:hypothetical protein